MASREERDRIAELIGGFRFAAGFGKTLSRLVRHGIGVHHAGMLPKYRRLVEQLAQAGLLKVICGTDTLGVGINVPIRTVLFTGADQVRRQPRSGILKAREFHQIAGRAGRAGYDTSGTVVVQAPEHVIENEKALAKAGDDPKKRRKVAAQEAPGGLRSPGASQTFDRLVAAEPEPLVVPSLRVSHSMLLNVIARPGDPFAAMRTLLTRQPREPGAQHRAHRPGHRHLPRRCWPAGVVERLDRAGRDRPHGPADRRPAGQLRAQPAAVAVRAGARSTLLDPESPTYALDVVSVIEATLDDPRQVLSAQQFKARGEAVAADEGRGHRVRRADGAARGRHLAQAARGAARGRLRDVPAGPPVGRRLRARRPSRWSATCTSGR